MDQILTRVVRVGGLDMLRHDSTHMDSEVPHNWTWSSSQTVCLCILTQINCLPVSKVVIGQNNCRPKMDGMVLWATAWLCTKPLTSHIWLVFELINQTKWWAWHSPHDFHGPIHFEVDWGVLMLPSGKHTKNYGKSPFLMGKSTINGPFSIAMLVYRSVCVFQIWSFTITSWEISAGQTDGVQWLLPLLAVSTEVRQQWEVWSSRCWAKMGKSRR